MSEPGFKIFRVIFSVFLLISSAGITAQNAERGDDILAQVKKTGQADVIIAYPGYEAMNRLSADFSVSSCNGKQATLTLSPLTDTLFIRLNIPYTLVARDASKAVYTASSVKEAMQWHSYPTYRQYDTIMHLLASSYPDLCVLDTLGYSIKGHAIYALKISDNTSVEQDKPRVFLTSTIHGDELGGFVMMMRLAEELLTGGGSDEVVSAIRQGLEVWINPLSNPDGTYNNGDVITSPVRFNSNGVDLNRNFPGPNVPQSIVVQKENQVMTDFLKKKSFSLSVNFHGGSEVVNYPWDTWSKLHPDDEWFYDISRRYADTVHLHSPAGYMTFLDDGVTNGAAWYIIEGGRQDYVTWALHGREVTIELDNNKETPASDLETLWNSNNRSFLRYISEALTGIRGYVTDSVTSLPVRAKVFISGHDADSSEVYSDAATGRYNRLIAPGSWNITFTANGYMPYTADNVTLTWDQPARKDVKLKPKTGEAVKTMKIWPVPSTGKIHVRLPDTFDGNVRFTVTSLSGIVVKTFTWYFSSGVSIPENAEVTDLDGLSAGTYILKAVDLSDNSSVSGRVVVVKAGN